MVDVMKQEKQDEVLKRVWIVKALNFQKAALVRGRNKEIVGSEIYSLRTREIEFLDKLIEEMQK